MQQGQDPFNLQQYSLLAEARPVLPWINQGLHLLAQLLPLFFIIIALP
jgi:hypothetical protein